MNCSTGILGFRHDYEIIGLIFRVMVWLMNYRTGILGSGLAEQLYRASYSTLPASPPGSDATYRVSSAQGPGMYVKRL
jgi:hypothetical protein